MSETFLLKTAIEFLKKGCESTENVSTTTNDGPGFNADSNTGDCGAESAEQFARQLTQPTQAKKGGTQSDVSFDRFRPESVRLFQVGTRNKVVGNATLEALKVMHKTVQDTDQMSNPSSLFLHCWLRAPKLCQCFLHP